MELTRALELEAATISPRLLADLVAIDLATTPDTTRADLLASMLVFGA